MLFPSSITRIKSKGGMLEMITVYINNQYFGEINNSGIILDINGSKVGYYTGNKILTCSGSLIGEVYDGYILDADGNKIGWIT